MNYKLCAILIAMSVLAEPADTPWDALRRLPKRHVYTAITRGGACVTGAFVFADDKGIVLAVPSQSQRTLLRPDILRISVGERPDVHSIVYSARSSWADLIALETPPYYSDLLVITSDNRQFRGPLLGVSPNQLTLFVDNHEMRFAKEYIDRVFLTSTTPTLERSGPRRSFRLSKKGNSQTQSVPLYEVNQPQDDSPLICSSDYRRQ